MKAMVLAAGRGERLRPLTDTTPKPLISVAGKPLVAYTLESLAQCGITEIVMNISYLAEQFYSSLGDGTAYGVKIQYSYEPSVLDTGGGVFQALPLLGDEPFLLIAGDIWTRYPWERLRDQQLSGLAHLILADNPDFKEKGDYHLEGSRVSLEGELKLTYASFALIHPQLFQGCQPGAFSIVPLFNKAIQRDLISGEHFTGDWINVGTTKELALVKKRRTAFKWRNE